MAKKQAEEKAKPQKTFPEKVQAGFKTLQQSLYSDYYDYSLVLVIVLLMCFGLITLYSASSYKALRDYGNDMYYFGKQALISIAGFCAAILLSLLDYRKFVKMWGIVYVAALVLMALVHVPGLGVTVNGATRWLKLGPLPQLQPSEISKLAIILCIACLAVDMGRNIEKLPNCAILVLLGGIQGAAAYKLTSNLSTAIIIVCITVGLMFIVHPNWKVFVILAVFVIALAVLYVVVFYYTHTEPPSETDFRAGRIYYWLHPGTDTQGKQYQTMQALYAIGSGGFFGRGFGNGTQKLGNVPEIHTDMIFSVICEEWGVFGVLILFVLFGFLLYRLLFIATNARDLTGSLIVCGVFIHIALQVILNVAVVCNLMPNTGVSLPFISYGGSSTVFLMAEIGFVLGVSRRIRFLDPVNS